MLLKAEKNITMIKNNLAKADSTISFNIIMIKNNLAKAGPNNQFYKKINI